MQCFESPFVEYSFNIDFNIFSCHLNRVNAVVFVILFLRSVFNWLDTILPEDRKSNLLEKMIVALISAPFCFYFGFPLLLFVSFFFTCKYYPYATSALLAYFFLPWISSKLASFSRESVKPSDRGTAEKFENKQQSVMQKLQEAGDCLKPLNEKQASFQPEAITSAYLVPGLKSAGDFLQSWQVLPLPALDSSTGAPSSAHRRFFTDPLQTLKNPDSVLPNLQDNPTSSRNNAASPNETQTSTNRNFFGHPPQQSPQIPRLFHTLQDTPKVNRTDVTSGNHSPLDLFFDQTSEESIATGACCSHKLKQRKKKLAV